MRNKSVSLIINPRTGENTAKLQDILAVFSAAGWQTNVRLKEYGKHVMQLSNKAAENKQNLIVAYGGDGTLNQVVNGVMSAHAQGKQHSTVGLIPGGTANVWAGEIGVPTDPVKAALALVNSEPRKVDVGRLAVSAIEFPGEEQGNGEQRTDGKTVKVKPSKAGKKATEASKGVRHHFLLMAGIGIDAAIMSGVSKPLKYNIGPWAVGWSAAKKMSDIQPFPIEIQSGDDGEGNTWRGEALQLVIGNSRRYAKVEKITPNAYMDDGKLDLCVITSGTPLNTVQQLTSLLLRQKPDNATAEYFRGAHLRIRVPASVPFQLDGSDAKLKDYLSSADYKRIAQMSKEELNHVFVTYQLDTLPHALDVAVPLTYDNELFKHADSEEQKHADDEQKAEEQNDAEHPTQLEHTAYTPVPHARRFIFGHRTRDDEGALLSEEQRKTLESETGATSDTHDADTHNSDNHDSTTHDEESHSKLHDQQVDESEKTSQQAEELLKKSGRYITVIGKVSDPAHPHTYIIAGKFRKASTGEEQPGAVVVSEETTIINAEGREFAHATDTLQELAEGDVIVVDGKRNKRNVLQARKLVLV